MTTSKRRLKDIKAIRDEDIDYSDIPELGDDFFRQADVWMPPEKPKEQLTVRFDADIVDWFKKQGRGYQTTHERGAASFHGNPARPRTRIPQTVGLIGANLLRIPISLPRARFPVVRPAAYGLRVQAFQRFGITRA